jgi:hypothetical protein
MTVSTISLLVVMPSYSWFHKQVQLCFHWNFSGFDRFTVAAALDDAETVKRVLVIALVYTLIAYCFLLGFCWEMSQTEFTSTDEFIERFVAKHAVFIRGVNPEIGTH